MLAIKNGHAEFKGTALDFGAAQVAKAGYLGRGEGGFASCLQVGTHQRTGEPAYPCTGSSSLRTAQQGNDPAAFPFTRMQIVYSPPG